MYIKITNGNPEIYSIGQLISDNPNISFPTTISEEILEKFDIYPFITEEIPTINEKTQKIENGDFAIENGKWIKRWKITNKTQEEIDEWILNKSNRIRSERNQLLAQTDHFALSDNTLTPEMKTYRQALRDIPNQSGFPENVVWPVKPV